MYACYIVKGKPVHLKIDSLFSRRCGRISFVSISLSDVALLAVCMIAFSWPRPSHVTEICPLLSVSSRVLSKLLSVSAS